MPTEMFTKEFLVKESQTAKMLGSGDLEVLGTPALAAMVEQTAKEAVKEQLSVGETTVGTVLELRHLYPSAVGATIVVTMTSIEQTAHKIRYEFVAYEGERQIAKGSHQRAVVEIDSFLKRITKDHSLVQELLDNGTITNEEAFNHPNKNVITRAVGTNYTVKADYYDIDLEDIDRIILCSDGLTNEVTELELKNVLIENKKDSCKALIELSNLKGGRDNISIIIFKGECADDRNYIG